MFGWWYGGGVKYGEKDGGNEMVGREVLRGLEKGDGVCVVSYGEGLGEKVV